MEQYIYIYIYDLVYHFTYCQLCRKLTLIWHATIDDGLSQTIDYIQRLGVACIIWSDKGPN